MKIAILTSLIICTIFVLIRFIKQERNIYFQSGIKAVLFHILMLVIGIVISIFI